MWIKKWTLLSASCGNFPLKQEQREVADMFQRVKMCLRVSQLGLGSACYKILLKAFDLLYPLYQH